MTRLRRLSRRVRDPRGSSLIEAAIVTPLLLLLTFSIVDFASLLYVYLALENGVGQATRYGITGNTKDDPDNPGSKLSREGSIKLAMREATPLTLGDEAFAFAHQGPGGNTWVAGAGGPNDIDKVTVNYLGEPMTPFMEPFFDGGQMVVTVESAMKNEGRFE